MESGIEPRKVKDIVMKDGGILLYKIASAEKKLDTIEDLVLQQYQVTSNNDFIIG